MATISIHFDGPITINHKAPIRVLANTYTHVQRAIDRAFLIETYGDVYKHQRLTSKQYADTVFLAEYPREGGIILDAFREGAGNIVDRIAESIRPVIDRALARGLLDHSSLSAQFRDRETYVIQMRENTQNYEEVVENAPTDWKNAYSNRSIVKEIDQLVSQITPTALAGSTAEIELHGNRPHLPYRFDARTASRFHKIAAHKELGAATIVNCVIRSLDRGNKNTKPSAKIHNLNTGREQTLLCFHHGDADRLHPHHNSEPVRLYVCPLFEALGFDVMSGDLVFIAVA
ncbi:hypothetical protein [uncultured Variovorax sp.]|uniref:hypothetical protein n=1 Tax=uncultured Variovorax sp. TaxID=114708 RepID=UPI0025D3F6E8|nr:hypothetical protein [uncultured Variovorax sp.]